MTMPQLSLLSTYLALQSKGSSACLTSISGRSPNQDFAGLLCKVAGSGTVGSGMRFGIAT